MNTSTPAAFTTALQRFQNGLTATEIAEFRVATIDDVWDMATKLQEEQSERRSMQNMARIEPFISGLTRYAGVIEVFVQAKPDIMAFVWGPLKMLLQIASNFTNHFEKLVDAFQRIGENLPRFATYEKIFQYDPRLQEVVALVYEDIMDFLRRTWKFFHRRSWHIIFDSTWNDFDSRFKSILDKLSRHKELLDKEAIVSGMQQASSARKAHEEKLGEISNMLAEEIKKASDARQTAEVEFERRERERLQLLRRAVFTWIDGNDGEDDREMASSRRHPDTGGWIFDRKEFDDWLEGVSTVLWLTGKPGCGKTILASAIIDELKHQGTQTVLYFFCDYKNMCKNTLHTLLRAFTCQFLSQNPDMLPFSHQWVCASPQIVASLTTLKKHFKELLQSCTEPIHLILDGLDECDGEQQTSIQAYLNQVVCGIEKASSKFLRVCIISRQIQLHSSFQKLVRLKINVGQDSNGSDIERYVVAELHRVQKELAPDIILTTTWVNSTISKLVNLADGMFLWVRLVIECMLQATTLEEVEEGVENLPEGLDQAYGRILQQIERSPNNTKCQQTLRILKWLACACRPVTVSEVESWLTIDPESDRRKGRPTIKDCGMLFEIIDSRIQFIHFSAKEYILAGNGGELHVSPFLSRFEAHLNAFKACVRYLSSDFFSIDTSFTLQHLLAGGYNLMSYCKGYWIVHLEECLMKLEADASHRAVDVIVPTLSNFLQAVKNNSTAAIGRASPKSQSPFSVLETVGRMAPDLLSLLFAVKQYKELLNKQYMKGLSVQDLHQWHIQNDPLLLTARFWKAQTNLEENIVRDTMNSSDQQALQRLCGQKVYVCHHPACENSTAPKAFISKRERQTHEDKHSRPFMCEKSTCDYRVIGFATKKGLAQHYKKYHLNENGISIDLPSLNEIIHDQRSEVTAENQFMASNQEENDPWERNEEEQTPSDNFDFDSFLNNNEEHHFDFLGNFNYQEP